MHTNTQTRIMVVQALYNSDMSGNEDVETLFQAVGNENANIDKTFFADLVQGVNQHNEKVDHTIARFLEDKWTIKRLGVLLRAVLRAAVYELIASLDTPVKVIISEYVEVAKEFLDPPEVNFVNAILDKIACDLRAGELKST